MIRGEALGLTGVWTAERGSLEGCRSMNRGLGPAVDAVALESLSQELSTLASLAWMAAPAGMPFKMGKP